MTKVKKIEPPRVFRVVFVGNDLFIHTVHISFLVQQRRSDAKYCMSFLNSTETTPKKETCKKVEHFFKYRLVVVFI